MVTIKDQVRALFNKKIVGKRPLYGFQLTLSVEDNSDDETIDTQDTRHDNRYDRLEDQIWLEDTHAADADTTLGSTVGSTEV